MIGMSEAIQGQGRDTQLPMDILAFPWVQDGISAPEGRTAGSLGTLANKDPREPALARLAVSLPWIADGPSAMEAQALRDMTMAIRSRNLKTFRTLAGLNWVADGISESEARTLSEVGKLLGHNPPYKTTATMPFLETHEDSDQYLIRALNLMATMGMAADISRSQTFIRGLTTMTHQQ